MTESKTLKGFLFLIASLFALALGLRYSELCAEGVRYGIELSVSKLIPSLFPFLVISDIIVRSGACDALTRLLGGAFSAIFGMSREGALPFFLGMMLGFPIGIRSAISLYESGRISRAELLRLSLFTSIPSPAFLISAVGEGLFGSWSFGLTLYFIAIFVSIVIGMLSRFFFSEYEGEYFCIRRSESRSFVGVGVFLDAVSSSAMSLLSISAFVVFFSMLCEVLEHLLANVPFFDSPYIITLFLGSLEMTGGAARAALLGVEGAPLAAAILGFSGLSVLCQFSFACREGGLSAKPYFLSKLFSSGAYFLLSLGAIRLFGDKMGFSEPYAPSFILYRENRLSLALFAFFICACFVAVNDRKRKIFTKSLYKR